MAIFLLLVLPGIALELLRQRSRPGRADSVFVETARVLFGGAAVTVLTLLVLGLIRTAAPAVMLDPRQLWLEPRYVADHLWLTVCSLTLFLLVSLTLATLCYALLPAPGLAGNVHMESAWVSTFSRLPQRLYGQQDASSPGFSIRTQLQVELTDGTAYLGIRDTYSADAALVDRELVLAPPMHVRRAEGSFEPLEPGWQRIILPASQIRTILVRFIQGAPSATPSPLRGRRITRFFGALIIDPWRLAAILGLEILIPLALGIFLHRP
ncbi:hypothetical protein KBX39_00130 [Micromonospora sp. D75]|nr:hypothetical protein [Micromonospora sp. D75]